MSHFRILNSLDLQFITNSDFVALKYKFILCRVECSFCNLDSLCLHVLNSNFNNLFVKYWL